MLKAYVRPRQLGLLPDAGFYAAARSALVTDRPKPIPFAPDVAVDVASPRQTQEDMDAKATLYMGGVTLRP